jgi:hypothetical protein
MKAPTGDGVRLCIADGGGGDEGGEQAEGEVTTSATPETQAELLLPLFQGSAPRPHPLHPHRLTWLIRLMP